VPPDERGYLEYVTHERRLPLHVVIGGDHHCDAVGVAACDGVGRPQDGRRRTPVLGLDQAFRPLLVARELLCQVRRVPRVGHHEGAPERDAEADAIEGLAEQRPPPDQRRELLRAIIPADEPR
jgi:hypothetical protein